MWPPAEGGSSPEIPRAPPAHVGFPIVAQGLLVTRSTGEPAKFADFKAILYHFVPCKTELSLPHFREILKYRDFSCAAGEIF